MCLILSPGISAPSWFLLVSLTVLVWASESRVWGVIQPVTYIISREGFPRIDIPAMVALSRLVSHIHVYMAIVLCLATAVSRCMVVCGSCMMIVVGSSLSLSLISVVYWLRVPVSLRLGVGFSRLTMLASWLLMAMTLAPQFHVVLASRCVLFILWFIVMLQYPCPEDLSEGCDESLPHIIAFIGSPDILFLLVLFIPIVCHRKRFFSLFCLSRTFSRRKPILVTQWRPAFTVRAVFAIPYRSLGAIEEVVIEEWIPRWIKVM